MARPVHQPREVVRDPAAADRAVPLGDREVELKFVLTPLTRYIGHRVVATGTLIGEGGSGGINVDSVSSLATTCE